MNDLELVRLLGVTPSCANCAHLRSILTRTCGAYPDGIPVDVFTGATPHLETLPGDGGVRWEPNEELRRLLDAANPEPGGR